MSASTVLAVREQTSKQSGPTRVPAPTCNFSIADLCALITLLVLAHQVVLAYIRWAPPPSTLTALPHIWPAFPVVDPQRLDALGRFAGFNDMFFIALMFFISGLYAWRSLVDKGAVRFLGRALRLGLPFAGAETIVAPLACYATSIRSGIMDGSAAFSPGPQLARRWRQWYAASLVAFAAGTGMGIAALRVGSRACQIAGDSALVLCSAASSFAFLGFIIRFAGKRQRILGSLNENACGIYLVHYACVSWVQPGLLKLDLPAMVKAPMVFVSAGLLSWGTVALIGRISLSRLRRRVA